MASSVVPAAPGYWKGYLRRIQKRGAVCALLISVNEYFTGDS